MNKNYAKCKCGYIYYIGYCECPMCKIDKENNIGMVTLKELWKVLSDIPIDNQDRIEKDFVVTDEIFPKGTHKFDIWHWFDEKCPNNLHDDLMFNKKGE